MLKGWREEGGEADVRRWVSDGRRLRGVDWMQPSEGIRKLRLGRTPSPHAILARAPSKRRRGRALALCHFGSNRASFLDGGGRSLAFLAVGGAASQSQPASKPAEELEQRWTKRGGGVLAVLDSVGIRYNFNVHQRRRFMQRGNRRHAREGLPLGLGKLRRTAARAYYVFCGISHL